MALRLLKPKTMNQKPKTTVLGIWILTFDIPPSKNMTLTGSWGLKVQGW